MNNRNYNFGTLVKYEFKKLLHKKIVWIALAVIGIVTVLSNMSVLFYYESFAYTDTNGGQQILETMSGYERMTKQSEYAKALDGEVIDAALVLKAWKDMRWNRRMLGPYDEIYDIADTVLGGQADWEKAAPDFYILWRRGVGDIMQEQRLRAGETAYWEKKLDKIETPFTYRYAMAYENILGYTLSLGITALLLNAICLAGVFSDEHQKKTDQLILCMKNGKDPVYFAKMMAGMLFGVCAAFLMCLITVGFSFGFYGTKGFNAMLQTIIVHAPFTLTAGGAVFVMLGIILLSAVLESALVMMLSEMFKNPVGVMAVMVGFLFLSQITLPESWRFLSQALTLLPTALSAAWNFADLRLIKLGGLYLTNFGFAALLYPLLTAVFLFFGRRSYIKYQDGAR